MRLGHYIKSKMDKQNLSCMKMSRRSVCAKFGRVKSWVLGEVNGHL